MKVRISLLRAIRRICDYYRSLISSSEAMENLSNKWIEPGCCLVEEKEKEHNCG